MVGGGCAAGAVRRSDFLSVPLPPHKLVRHSVVHRAQCPARTERREAHRRGARATLRSVFCVPVLRRGTCRGRASGGGGEERYTHQRQGQGTPWWCKRARWGQKAGGAEGPSNGGRCAWSRHRLSPAGTRRRSTQSKLYCSRHI